MTTIRLVMGDQLSRNIAALRDAGPDDIILMVEVAAAIAPVPHHKQKIVLVLSAMRHFAEELRHDGLRLDYVGLEDTGNTQNFTGEVQRAIARHGAVRLVVTEASEWQVAQEIETWRTCGISVEVREDDRFVCSHQAFRAWAGDRKALRMEYFYRQMRKMTRLLMDGDAPVGGAWNFDRENRKPLPAGVAAAQNGFFAPDAITREVAALVERRFPDHFGALDGFGWAVTRQDALQALDRFVRERLPCFGDYQDAMRSRDPFLFHALLSPYLNIGLLQPLEVCRRAEQAWLAGDAPLNAVEGFVRQIIGWREYVRGIYWLKMPGYQGTNALGAYRPLPDFYWTGKTQMNCMAGVVDQIRRHGYAHHIQRLMVTGNFALLAGLAPAAVERWYLAVFMDAFEWVELPNTHGMALFADGGLMASKPYAASAAYISKMSDYCRGCRFSPAAREGGDACPFNYLYWNFLERNREALQGNPRLAMIYRTLDAMLPARKAAIRCQSENFLASLDRDPVATQGDLLA